MSKKINENGRTREEAEMILAKMNDMAHGRNFAKVIMDDQFDQLNEKIHELGWLALVQELNLENHELHVQLKLVDPDSEEARDLP